LYANVIQDYSKTIKLSAFENIKIMCYRCARFGANSATIRIAASLADLDFDLASEFASTAIKETSVAPVRRMNKKNVLKGYEIVWDKFLLSLD